MTKWHEVFVYSSLWLVFKRLYGNKHIFLNLEFTFSSILCMGNFNNFGQSNILSKMKVAKSDLFSVKMRTWTYSSILIFCRKLHYNGVELCPPEPRVLAISVPFLACLGGFLCFGFFGCFVFLFWIMKKKYLGINFCTHVIFLYKHRNI